MRRRRLLAAAALLVAFAVPGRPEPPVRVTTLTLFAGTAEGLWRTADWGRRWERVHGRATGVSLAETGAVRAVQAHGTRVWIAADAGLFSSEDFGDTWIALASVSGARSLLLPRYDVDPTVFVGTGAGVLRSRDRGRTFAPTALAGAVGEMHWPGPALVAAGDGGVLVTTDEGATWRGPGAGLPPGAVNAVVLSSFYAVDPVLFAAAAAGGVYRSSDGGASWAAAGLHGDRVHDLVWLGPFLYAAGESGFHRSADAGASWTRLSATPGRPARVLFPLAPAAGLEAFLATDRGIFHTADAGEHWEPAGLSGQAVLEIATFPPAEPAPTAIRR